MMHDENKKRKLPWPTMVCLHHNPNGKVAEWSKPLQLNPTEVETGFDMSACKNHGQPISADVGR